jgi:Zn-dependent peptidase ImmA (M78 family)/predicted secreted protein
MAAARLLRKLGAENAARERGGNVDVFGAMLEIELPHLLRPLKGLLGAYLHDPTPGVLVTTQRPLSVQRFTAAHELGHFTLEHEPSLDDERILRRMVAGARSDSSLQEVEANAFAAEFLMPRWLISWHCARQGWTAKDFADPSVLYQLSLRMGVSFEAACWTLNRDGLISGSIAERILEMKPRELKRALLSDYEPPDYRGDVWLLTERDAGTRIEGSRQDLFVLRLQENSNAGYVWDFETLHSSGFAIVRDGVEALDSEGVGSPVIRRVTAKVEGSARGTVSVEEKRPWIPEECLNRLTLDYDLTGPEEEGLSRAERRQLLEAA